MCINYKIKVKPDGGFNIDGMDIEGAETYVPSEEDIWPKRKAPVVRVENGKFLLNEMQWGLLQLWVKDEKEALKSVTKFHLHNARIETLNEKATFRNSFGNPSTRCLLAMTAYSEAEHFISLESNDIFFVAGIYNVWKSGGGIEIPSFTMVTTEPNALLKKAFETAPPNQRRRMPAHLTIDEAKEWLDPNNNENYLKELIMSERPNDGFNFIKEN